MVDSNDLMVLIPYKQLDALLTVARELDNFRFEVKRCYEQLDACRGIQVEILDKYKELKDLL